MIARSIEITPLPGCDGYNVIVQPPVPDEPLDAEFPGYRRARAWADGLRQTRGWRIVDRSGLEP
ncbi:hypothetical protein [Sphingobium limneticum]|uniref:Uncharacterized protein n=1 Tax=Sphingobium limneticum TaxID=1007511 RepID=A0A5J5I867_9SPHN|nr:hypothetical protein [Sphingobium limneticum]KAA9019832.1 hypothetical protein F4U96_06245 [Sphingobium limneticum]KAA9032290.1 hypothetical protein F4U95_06245 [Sphingobium limneticum]